MAERTVVVTDDDVRFVERCLEHYRIFAEVSEKQGEDRTTAIFQKQVFYAERFLTRLA